MRKINHIPKKFFKKEFSRQLKPLIQQNIMRHLKGALISEKNLTYQQTRPPLHIISPLGESSLTQRYCKRRAADFSCKAFGQKHRPEMTRKESVRG